MTTLINISDIQAVESISSNLNVNKKLNPHILDAQECDVRPLLGEEFWIDIVDNLSDYDDLWLEHTYTHAGHTYRHPGLKYVLIMYTYARYKDDAQMHDTAHGVVMKTTEFSTPVSDKAIARAGAKARSSAQVYWSRVKQYLDRKYQDYPLWHGTAVKSTGNGLKIKKVSKF